MSDLQHQIEEYLLKRGGWVKSSEIEEQFGVSDRQLRQVGSTPGLVTDFALSLSGRGYIHINLASTSDWIHAKNAALREAYARFRRVKRWKQRRSSVCRSIKRPSRTIEKDTGQVIFDGF